jgi:CDP-diacylglycerol--serine O-phosphatidyltransferase
MTDPAPKPGNGRVALVQLVPNAMTLAAICAGITSIRFSVTGDFGLAVALQGIASLLDGLDGRVARALRSESLLGAELDSLADIVNFGVAPAMLMFFFCLSEIPVLGWGAALAYVMCCALRLARFNADDKTNPASDPSWFTGVPSPAGAMLALAPVFLMQGWPELHLPAAVAAIWLIAAGGLMVSRIPTVSLKMKVTRPVARVLLVAMVAVVVGLANSPWQTLFVVCVLYLAVIPYGLMRHRRMNGAGRA